jgi:PPK2 family polyphosphate:nucleotide phosphotransferase
MKSDRAMKDFLVDHPDRLRLDSYDCAETGGLDKDEAKRVLEKNSKRLAKLQERLYVDGRWALLIVLQGMDTAGKDGIIEHVMSGVNPQGCEVHAFKTPSDEELAHDFLWRAAVKVPQRGRIGIFNRSHYEEVLIVRVHPELLARQKLPIEEVGAEFWEQRFEDIRNFERHLARNGTLILKFFLHVSKEEQRRRLLARIDDPSKHWKSSPGDIAERKLWDKYMAAYEAMIRGSSRPEAPWYVVPADNKWFARLVVARAITGALESLPLESRRVKGPAAEELARMRAALLAEGASR